MKTQQKLPEDEEYSIEVRDFGIFYAYGENIFYAMENIENQIKEKVKVDILPLLIIDKAFVIKNQNFIIDITDLV